LIDALHGVQKNVVVVLMNGSAVSMPWSSRVPAILEAWLAGQAGGEAIVDVLTGTVNPSGKLSETFAVRLEDTPAYLDFPSENGQARYGERVFIGYRYYEKRRISPLFPFGHGLSYSSFAYRDLRAEVRNLERDEFAVSVTVFVKNTSARSGKEIVQLYVREQSPRCLRPDKELKGFAKVLLEAGEERSLQFELESRDFAYFDTAVGEFVVDAGKFDILVGGSSNAPALVATVEVPQLRRSQRKLDRTSSLKDFLEHPRGQALYSAVLAALMPADESNHDVDADAQKKARDMTLAFLRELPVWKLPAMSGGKFSAADLDKLLEAVR
jgi:beta-glucosidase